MHTEIVYGYGFPVYADDEALARFILKHEKAVRQSCDRGADIVALAQMWENASVESKPLVKEDELLLNAECNVNRRTGPYAVVANVISAETGLNIQYEPGGEDDDETIMLAYCAPWLYSEKERSLTEDELHGTLGGYVRELQLPDEPHCIRVEYWC